MPAPQTPMRVVLFICFLFLYLYLYLFLITVASWECVVNLTPSGAGGTSSEKPIRDDRAMSYVPGRLAG